MPGRRALTAMQLAEHRRRIMRTELTTGIGCALLGAAFLAGGHTQREMSIFLFGWAAGCAVHLTQTLLTSRLANRRAAKDHDVDDP